MIDKALYKNKKTKPVKQAGVMNYLGEQKMVTAPKFWLSEPGHVKAKLAYITDEEEKILIDKNLYGSLKGKPNKGPAGLPSLQGGDFGSEGAGTGDSQGGGDKGNTGKGRDLDFQQRGMTKGDYAIGGDRGQNFGGRESFLDKAVSLYRKLPTPTNIALNLAQKFGPTNNLDFYNEKVVPAGRTDLGFKDYMSARMAGTIDAYGNPIDRTGDGGRQNILQTGIMGVQEVMPSETKDPLSKSVSLRDLDFNYGTFSNPVMYKDLV